MPQRFTVCLILVCSLLVMTSGSAVAARTFAVAPLKIHAPDKYNYLSHGISSMIASRLNKETSLQAKEDPISGETKELSRDQALEILTKADLDYLIYGRAVIMKEQLSVSLNMLSREDELMIRTFQMPLDNLIPRMDTIVGEIKQELGVESPEQPKHKAEPAPETESSDNHTIRQDEYTGRNSTLNSNSSKSRKK
ncbi:MAG: hypothetical protein K9K39_04190 [Desulfohalobiaceae bacterium]|nr:hypothetical protein [Desulfohalobiaceae bacterium]